jgi:hypothetical protein
LLKVSHIWKYNNIFKSLKPFLKKIVYSWGMWFRLLCHITTTGNLKAREDLKQWATLNIAMLKLICGSWICRCALKFQSPFTFGTYVVLGVTRIFPGEEHQIFQWGKREHLLTNLHLSHSRLFFFYLKYIWIYNINILYTGAA